MNFNQLKEIFNYLPEYRLIESNWHQYVNPNGFIGGWIENSAYVENTTTVWIGPTAIIYDNARIYGNAWVSGNARVFEDARVYGSAEVYNNAQVYGNAWIYDNAEVYGDARISGYARVFGFAKISSGYVDYNIPGEQAEPREQTKPQVTQLPDYEKQFLSRIDKIINRL
jgi:NDP-sugar pyrophosphorylase family protein